MNYIACKIVKKENVIIVKKDFYLPIKILLYAYEYFTLVILKSLLIKSNYVYLQALIEKAA